MVGVLAQPFLAVRWRVGDFERRRREDDFGIMAG